jgi:hypothetical protein
VSPSDLARVIRRDFPAEEQAGVTALLDTYKNNEAVRVKLAILKLAAGDVQKIRHYVAAASTDYRDVLAWAEYPEFMDRGLSPNLPPNTRDAIITGDWEQYETWLKRP